MAKQTKLQKSNDIAIERMNIKRQIRALQKAEKAVPQSLKDRLAKLEPSNNGSAVKAKPAVKSGETLTTLKREAKSRKISYWFAMNRAELTAALAVKASDKGALEKIIAPARKRYTDAQKKYKAHLE